MICYLCKLHKPAPEFCGKGTVCKECRGTEKVDKHRYCKKCKCKEIVV